MEGLNKLALSVGTNDYSSDFEIASIWSETTRNSGSFLMIGCHNHAISISSFVLGKFRAATYIKFDHCEDLPYLWLQNCSTHTVDHGVLHDHTYLFGKDTHGNKKECRNISWDASTKAVFLNTLDEMGVLADEITYGFDLAEAFPAIILVEFLPKKILR